MATLNVNGQVRTHDAEPDTPLLWVLRSEERRVGKECVP